mmetsp:Transcript_22118/g.32669  ORF Transcript_22118/g.32669 Transcript_22118/m.32669 type:complete len:512 (-) Transcript_22118:116-1651(-)|eukprot:CAMPEP_0194225858 /NCGR_PEP_ID=MMETSP0156-20130528/40527_1 /TAXON_ID=33649 /ORGANISM="Thalassionema nitzschioides, Strain L26-B" /LENGTH=511 /DNA_ID=CAMNT_0038957981 /DNA_START=108 /DNA_END=1643 /DNA_ORIENTATION=+
MRQESHRIHWQQWVSNDPQSKRDLTTQSAAVRLTDAAKASDVIKLMKGDGALVLVGTLYNIAPIQFAHDPRPLMKDQSSVSTSPFHLVRTLQGEENPLQVRDCMQRVLDTKYKMLQQSSISSTIAPKFQWFFVQEGKPDSETHPGSVNTIPHWIDLDGYCTTMEEEDFESEEDDEEEDGIYSQGQESAYSDLMEIPLTNREEKLQLESSTRCSKYRTKQLQRHKQLAMYRTDHNRSISGYLWKQSHQDDHVWRKVHCVLSEDYLWYVTRVRSTADVAYHGRISLNRALLIDHHHKGSWEIVSASGRAHLFQAKAVRTKHNWMTCLKECIQDCQDNQLLQQAELIVSDETVARNKRVFQHCLNTDGLLYHKEWVLQVASYRELCRHIQQRLPSKTLVILTRSSSSKGSSTSLEETNVDEELQSMIGDAWELAADLLNHVNSTITKNSDTSNRQSPSRCNLETLCRHIDYILTGRMQPLSEGRPDSQEPPSIDKLRDPPPADLFDKLLVELGK